MTITKNANGLQVTATGARRTESWIDTAGARIAIGSASIATSPILGIGLAENVFLQKAFRHIGASSPDMALIGNVLGATAIVMAVGGVVVLISGIVDLLRK